MRQTLLIFVFLVQMVLAPFSTLAQSNYPIFVSPSLLPPYSLQLSDYSAHGSQRLMVTIVVNDLEVANLPVKLRLKMETAGATIETPATLNTTPIYLDGGSATVLFGEDLYDYFNLNNLKFSGFSKEAYQRSGQMPEGFYRFSIEVLHFHTNRVISNTGTTSAWMALGHPPVLRMPANDAELGQYMGVPITFSWLSSNVGSPVSAGSIRYKFELWEVRVKGVNPYNIVGSMPVFYEHVTSTNSYSFNPASVMMEEGMTYAWRVTAFDESGLVPFAQNGQSEVRTFTYKSRCEAVSDITATAGGQKGSFVWTPEKNHTSFNVEVRNADADWFSASETYDSKVEFFQLERGQTYELRVQAVCNGDAASVSDYSSWTSLLIPDKKPDESNDDCPDCACSDDLPDVELTNFELRHDLTVGDTLTNKTGTTRFIVREVNPQGNGIYSGIFYFWGELWGMKVPCEFSDLQVNTDNVIVNMDYKSINDPKFLVDVDVLVEKGNDFLDQLATVTAKTRIVDTISVQQEFDYVVVKDGELYAVVVEQDAVVERPMGVSLEEAKQKLIANADGDEVVISSKGEPMGVQEFKATGGNNRLVKSYNEQKEREQLTEGSMIGFSAYDKQNYGFDAYDPLKQKIQHFYPSMANGYQPAFKSVESFRYDKVLTDAPSGISFRDEMGIPALSVNGSLNIQGHVAGSNRALYAYRALSDSTEEVVGKLNVVSFDIATKRVHIVPVNGAKMPTQSQLEHTLKQVYKQAIATWTVVPEPGVLLDFPGGRMTHEGSGSFSTYNKDQTSIIEAYEATGRKLERGDLYLFFVDGATFKDRSLAGYMPLNRQVGFIYDNPSPIIVAHELGHGAFNLRHTFSPEALIANEFDTQNLMDYNGGSELWQHQWDLIHDPETMLFAWGQSEDEGAFESYEYLEGKNVVSGSFKEAIGLSASSGLSFVSRAGWVITIPSNAVDVTFNDNGTLMGFTITEDGKQERYVGAQYTKGEDAGKFAGFLKEFGSSNDHQEKVYKDEISKDLEGARTNVYFGIISSGNSDSPCEIYLFEGDYPLSDVSGNYNTGGNKQPKVNTETIKGKLLSTYTDNKVSVPAYGDKIKYLTSVKSEHACNNCKKGKTFYEEYESTATDEESKYFLTKVSQLICDNESEIVDYEMLKKQINWDFQRLIENSIWNSDKISFLIARNTFWERPDAWKLYFEALEKTKDKIEYYNKQLNADISEDDFRVAVYYLNDDFLATLTIAERVDMLAFIFDNNFFINDSWFFSGASDVSLITKIVRTLTSKDLSSLMSAIIQQEELFKDDNRDVLFEVVNGANEESLQNISLDLQLYTLKHLLGGSLVNIFEATNYHGVITKLLKSIKDENATNFFNGLLSEDYSVNGKPLISPLKSKLRDFLNKENYYTQFFEEIKRLSDARYIQEKGSLEITKAIIWDVKNVDAVLISYVRNNNDFDFKYDEDNNTVSISTCVKSESRYTPGQWGYGTTTKECLETEYILPENTDPFELIGITIINDISPFTGGCDNGQGGYGYCGEMFYIPAIFVEYLEQNVNTQRWKNFGWNTFNVVITAATLGEGAAAITAIKTAQAGTRVAVAAKHAYTLLDFTYTATNITLDASGVEMGPAWDAVGYLFAAKTSYDLISKGGAKGLAKLKKTSVSDKKRVIEKLGLNNNGKALTEAELDDYIKHVEAEIAKNPSSDFAKKYQTELKELENAGCISTLNKVDNIIDDVGNAALKEDDILDEIKLTNNSATDGAKKLWAVHEDNVTRQLRKIHGNTNVGRQITVEIKLKNGKTITCRVDNLVKEGNTYQIVDAKSSINQRLDKKSAETLANSWSTKNQKVFYDALKNGDVQSIKPIGNLAIDYFDGLGIDVPDNLPIKKSIDFYVNDVATDGYNIYVKPLNY